MQMMITTTDSRREVFVSLARPGSQPLDRKVVAGFEVSGGSVQHS
jgi:hypothetical protein